MITPPEPPAATPSTKTSPSRDMTTTPDKITLALTSSEVRAKAVRWVQGCSDGTRVTFEGPKRTLDQNAHLWPLLDDILRARPTHMGVTMNRDLYKALFLHALGQEVQFIPALDGSTMVPIGNSSSRLTKAQFSDLLELIYAWGAEKGVEFRSTRDGLDA